MKNYSQYVKQYLQEDYGLSQDTIDELINKYPIGQLASHHTDYKKHLMKGSKNFPRQSGLLFYALKGGGWLYYSELKKVFATITAKQMSYNTYKEASIETVRDRCRSIFKEKTVSSNPLFDKIDALPLKEGMSKGESVLYYLFTLPESWLSQHFIYEPEYNIVELTGYKYWQKTPRFDGALRNKTNNAIITFLEYDGIQHYEKEFTEDIANFYRSLSRDACKTGWAAGKGIPLLRIPYCVKTTEEIYNYINAWAAGYIKAN